MREVQRLPARGLLAFLHRWRVLVPFVVERAGTLFTCARHGATLEPWLSVTGVVPGVAMLL